MKTDEKIIPVYLTGKPKSSIDEGCARISRKIHEAAEIAREYKWNGTAKWLDNLAVELATPPVGWDKMVGKESK